MNWGLGTLFLGRSGFNLKISGPIRNTLNIVLDGGLFTTKFEVSFANVHSRRGILEFGSFDLKWVAQIRTIIN